MANLRQAIGRARADPRVDLVAISAHWGIDWVGRVLPSQRRWAHWLLNAGADLVLGHHSHVLQTMEKYVTSDGRETLAVYSLGNFISDMWGVGPSTTVVLYIGITKNESGAFLTGLQFLPVARHITPDERTGRPVARPVTIDRYAPRLFTRHRARVVRVLGSANLKNSDAPIDYPLP
jgi:hypothetical protein